MTTTTMNNAFASSRKPVVETVGFKGLLNALSVSLEMARMVGEYSPVSRRQLDQVRALTEKF